MTPDASLSGRRCVVTGANRGIGFAIARGLARLGADVTMICRRPDAARAAAQRIDRDAQRIATETVIADLSSQRAIRDTALSLKRHYDRIDVLVNNAAVFTHRRRTSVDGFEMQFAVNHLSYVLLTKLLLDTLVKSVPARIVNVASDAHHSATMNFDDLQLTRGYTGFRAYAQSKLANVYHTRELARRTAGSGVTANALHPGAVATNLLGRALFLPRILHGVLRLPFRSTEQGAETAIYLASDPEVAGVTGTYFKDCRPKYPSRVAQDDEAAARLWDVSERLVGLQ